MTPDNALVEGERIMTICNACRYCEGYCAVFPAMERRLNFAQADLDYLANLCHNCGECYYACQYAPPHEFAVNVPQTLATIRGDSYRRFAKPRVLAAAFDRNGLVVSLILALVLIIFLGASAGIAGRGGFFASNLNGDFYQVIPHSVMALLFGIVGLLMVAALAAGVIAFWRQKGGKSNTPVGAAALARGLHDAFSLKNLRGRGSGCTYPDENGSRLRRLFHHFTFYGFLLCFAATCVGTIYHYLFQWEAPYDYLSLPVLLGTIGGIGLVVGPIGLYRLKRRRDPVTVETSQNGMDVAFLLMLVLTSVTGLLLLALRETSAMGGLLVIHLGVVMALFLTLPYGKFVHGLYRTAALVRSAAEGAKPG